MKVIKDGRLLNKLAKQFNFEYCHIYKYITCECPDVMLPTLKLHGYAFKYFDGCFYPYLVKL